MATLADMDADKKVAVLKKAILALTKQKQDIEAARVALEAKVSALVEELGRAEERNESLVTKNKELSAEVERLQSSKGGLSLVPSAAARSLLGTLGTFGGGLKDGGISVEQQRLFEENEALHIQIFEQKTDYERRIKALEAERSEGAMKVHSLEGLVASIQASDVAQSQQAIEVRRELAIEKGYTNFCQYALFFGSHNPQERQPSVDTTNDAISAINIIFKRGLEVIQHSMSGVSALLPHTLATSASTSSLNAAASPHQLTQDAHRQRTVIAAHREFRNRINVLCSRLMRTEPDVAELEAQAETTIDFDSNALEVSEVLTALLSETGQWLNLLNNNANLLFGPLEVLHAARCRTVLHGSEASQPQIRTLEQQFQSVISELIGGLRVLHDCLKGTGVLGSNSSAPALEAVPFALRLIGAMLSYRYECAAAESSSYMGKLSVERLLFNIEAAVNYQGNTDGPTLPIHYQTPLIQLVATLKETSRQWATAFGNTAVFASFNMATGVGSSGSGPEKPRRNARGTLAKAMSTYFAKPLLRATISHNGVDDLQHIGNAARSLTSDEGAQSAPNLTPSYFATFEAEILDQLKAADANAMHCYALSQRAMLELAHCHDRIEALTAKATAVEGDNARMKKEYVSVVEVYESQIRLLSEHLAEVAQEGSVTRSGKKK